MQKVYRNIRELIESSENILITSHVDPDGDALGSMTAMHLILEQLGRKSDMFSFSGVPETYNFLPRVDKISKQPQRKKYDLLITVDASDLSRIGKVDITYDNIINIDHHPDNSNFGDINCVELLSSVAEQIYKIAKELKVEITQEIATSLYAAIMTDTGNFRYANTLPSTFKVAWELVDSGAVPWKIASFVYDTKSISGMKVLAHVLNNIKSEQGGKFIWSAVPYDVIQKNSAGPDDIISIIDYLRMVKGAEIAAFLREDNEGKIKINFRSKGGINVSGIAQELGGGGHIQAAGAVLKVSMKEAEELVVKAVLKHM